MNSTAKGNEYEDKVFSLVDKLLEDEALPFQKSSSVFHRRKDYFSQDRNSKIIFENVVEFFAKGTNAQNGQPSLVIIFECKSYAGLVDVSEVEEFKSKLDQLKGFRSKGYMVTKRGFKKAALAYAASHGIGLIRFVPEDQYEFVAYHMTSLMMQNIHRGFAGRAVKGLTESGYISRNETEYGFDRGDVYGDAATMIIKFIKRPLSK
jgi:hypothetical protein